MGIGERYNQVQLRRGARVHESRSCAANWPRCAAGRELSEPHPSCHWPNHSSRKHRAQHSLLWETILQLRLTNAAPPSEAPMRLSEQGGLCVELRGEAQLEIAVFWKNNIHVQFKFIYKIDMPLLLITSEKKIIKCI